MLRQLIISNYALIDHLEIDFKDGLSIITGETGAGKSIIIGALSLILGQKADARVVRDNTKKTVVEAEDKRKPLSDLKLCEILKEKGYEIARRTVAKYRERLSIPVARLRKEI